jgi:type II secretory pathway predicted ATPase ExeA/pSer/pThr/pTyr-binding forkhead associated (FHA) protein
MQLRAAGLKEQPFPTHGKPLTVLSYRSEREALDMLGDTCADRNGLCLLQGPVLSGKSTLLRSFVETLPEDCAVAIIDGRGLNATNLLTSVLREFGFNLETKSANELMGLVRVFVLQQASSHEPPVLIIENTHELNPSGLRALSELADLRVRTGSALKIVLASDRSLASVVSAPEMKPVSRRVLQDYHLRPMATQEVKDYLHRKLRAAGSEYPDLIFPDEVCNELCNASGGWPGILDRLALLALARAEALPVAGSDVEHPELPAGTWIEDEIPTAEPAPGDAPPPPRLIVTKGGDVVDDRMMDRTRLLIGRSAHNDISLDSNFVSRHHALLIHHGGSTLLTDLNSTNGTFVNSKRVSNHVLVHNDVITIGDHNIKVNDLRVRSRGSLDGTEFDDTTIVRTLAEMQDLLEQENTDILPVAADDPATIQV